MILKLSWLVSSASQGYVRYCSNLLTKFIKYEQDSYYLFVYIKI
jgi:hypothetical protein